MINQGLQQTNSQSLVENLIQHAKEGNLEAIQTLLTADQLNMTLQDFEKLFSELLSSKKEINKKTDRPFIKKVLGKFSECYASFLKNSPQEKMPPLTKSLRFLANVAQLYNLQYMLGDFKPIETILKNNIDSFITEDGMNDFVAILTSELPVHSQHDLLLSSFSHPEFVNTMQEKDMNKATKKMIDMIFGFDLGKKVKFIFTTLHMKDNQKYEEVIKALSQSISHELITEFKKDPEEWIESLKSEIKLMLKISQKQFFFSDSIKDIVEYLNDPEKPLKSKIKLFKAIFEVTTFNLLNEIDTNSEWCRDFVASYIKFIIDHWQENEVKQVLSDRYLQNKFFTILSKTSLPPSLFTQSLLEKMQKGYQEFEKEGLSPFYVEMLTSILPKLNSEDKEKVLNIILPILTKKDLKTFSNMIFIESPKNENNEAVSIPNQIGKVIYNQSGYDADVTFRIKGKKEKQGSPLIKDGTPIGYNIHLPKEKVKGIIVEVYSGFPAKNRKERLFDPANLKEVEQDLLSKGYAVVTLNLPNLLELNQFQATMPEDLHKKIHDSIHHFYDTIRNHPEVIHPDLHILKPTKDNPMPIHLYGASFGGRDVVKHAELYPEDFDGLISFDGTLTFEKLVKSDLPNVNAIRLYDTDSAINARKWLDPFNGIKEISKPLLILHNRNDNNVNLKVPLAFLKEARKAGKQDLLRLHITEKGPYDPRGAIYIGHFPSAEKGSFDTMMNAVCSFIEKGQNGLPALADWQALQCNILANKYYRSAKTDMRFVSEAYLRWGNKIPDEKSWKEDYVPLYYTLHYLDIMKKDAGKWLQEIKRLKDEGKLDIPSEVIRRGLQSFLNPFLSFLKEREDAENRKDASSFAGFAILKDLDMNFLLNNQKLQEEYVRLLTEDVKLVEDVQLVHFLMESLYMANPELLQKQFAAFENDPEVKKALDKAHQKLNVKFEKSTDEKSKQRINSKM